MNTNKIKELKQSLENQEQEIELLIEHISDDKLRELKLDKYIKNNHSYNYDFELEF